MFHRIVLTALISVLLTCCNSTERDNFGFVEKNGEESFDDFLGLGVHLRSVDEDGDLVVFVSSYRSECDAPFVVFLYKETGEMKRTGRNLLEDSCVIDERKLINLARKFFNYKVFLLGMDTLGNLRVNVRGGEGANLIRFSSLKNKTARYNDHWRQLKGNWFQKID